jgi:phosphoglycolate phosphatase
VDLNSPSLAIFDLDGTLVDSAEDIRIAANTVRHDRGLPSWTLEQVTPLIGLPARDLFHDADFDPSELESVLVPAFRNQLMKVTGTHTTVAPCGLQLLEHLRLQGWATAVATNKPRALAELVLMRAGLAPLIGVTVGSDGLPPKPDPAILLAVMERTSYDRGVMIGDTTMDIRAGQAAGLATVAVASGSHTVQQLAEHGPDMLIGSLCELVGSLG